MDRRDALATIQKATIDTSAGGQLPAGTADAFIDKITENSIFGSQINTEKVGHKTGTISKIGVGTRLIRGAVENSDDGYRAGVDIDDVQYAVKDLRLPFEITQQWAHRNIEGEKAKAKVINAMTKQFGQDLDDLNINGDEGSADAFLKLDDGLLDKCSTNASGDIHRVDCSGITSGLPSDDIFSALVAAMPNKYLSDPDLVWLASPVNVMRYIDWLADRGTPVGDAALQGKAISPRGIPFFQGQGSDRLGMPYMPNTRIILTSKKNLTRVIEWDIEKYSVYPGTDWELATRRKEGHIYFISQDFIINEDDAVVDGHTLDA